MKTKSVNKFIFLFKHMFIFIFLIKIMWNIEQNIVKCNWIKEDKAEIKELIKYYIFN